MTESTINIENFQKHIFFLKGMNESYSNMQPFNCERNDTFIINKSEEIQKLDKKSQETGVKRRKWSNDSIHKKLKRLFLKFLQKSYGVLFQNIPPKIPQSAISDVSIKFNKGLLNYTIGEFYEKICFLEVNINDIIDQSGIKKFLCTPLKDYYNQYLQDSSSN